MDLSSTQLLERPEWRILVALAIGLVIGVERERRKGEGEMRAAAGLRTFMLVALLGGLAAQIGGNAIVVIGGLFVATATLTGYVLGDRRDPGLTSEVALVVTYVLGVLAGSRPVLALEVSVLVTVLLAFRTQLHRLARDVLTERELLDGLILAMAALVVWPLLPNRAIDPYGLINPFVLWRLAVVLMGLSALGYIGQRIFGPRYGLAAAGFASGFVSSTAAIVSMGNHAQSDSQLASPAASGAIASVLGSLIYLVALVTAVNPALLYSLAGPLGFAVAMMLTYTMVLNWRLRGGNGGGDRSGRAFNPWTAILFAVLVAIFTAASTALTAWLGTAGALASAATMGLIDAHAAAVSLATLSDAGELDHSKSALGILIALSVNMAAKAPVAFASGPSPYALRVAAGLVLLLLGLWVGHGLVGILQR